MADSSSTTLLHAMDFFWFHHNILCPKPPSCLHHRAMELVIPPPELLTAEPPLLLKEQHFSSLPELAFGPLSEIDEECTKRRSSSLELVREDEISSTSSCSKLQSPLSSPAIKLQRTGSRRRGRIRSYKSLSELERDELKGFMDLGFTFKKEELNPRMISMIPGLQRLEAGEELSKYTVEEKIRDRVNRPYLSEAWLINKPDNPLLNFKIPRVSPGGIDMKKHLRFWARTVALVLQQES